MLAALKKQLQQQHRTVQREPQAALPSVAVLPGEELADRPLPPLSDMDAEKLAAVRALHPRLHESLCGLDTAQLAAILCDDASLLLRAPVGSGKTSVLVHKVLYLHFIGGVPLRQLAVLTFTNRAAAEIRARIEALADKELSAEDFWLTGTFHGVARALLARALPIEKLGYRRDFQVLDETAQELLLAELIAAHRLRIGRRSTLQKRLQKLAYAEEGSADLKRLGELFTAEKRRRNVMDFDDLIANAIALLPDPEAAEKADAGSDGVDAGSPEFLGALLPPRWLIVDEMQDCEPRELALLQRLRGADTHFFAVGDPNQAIYGWRGSAPEVFVKAQQTFFCRALTLPKNYRSTRTIVDAARSVLGLQPAAGSGSGALWATRSFGEPVVVRRHHDPISESLYLAARIAELHGSGVPYRELAVLFRLRAQAEPIRAALTARQIPCSEPEEEAGDDAVRLLTLHAAKGLEFRQVFLSGMNDGLMPLGPRFDLCADAEERRLLFVGLTRARDRVEISYHSRPHEHCAAAEPSPYLAWIPAALIVWEKDTPVELAPVAAEPAESVAPAASPWQPGQSIRHPRYGAGTIVRVTASTIDCSFGKLGEKSFPILLCPLSPIS